MRRRPQRSSPFRVRFSTYVRRWELDRQLADGSSRPESDVRSARAAQLASPRTRSRLARSMRGVVQEARSPHSHAINSPVPVCRRSITPFCEALLGLAERLECAATVNPCGLARTRLLLTDGTGPLYNPAAERSLADAIWWIADGLQPPSSAPGT